MQAFIAADAWGTLRRERPREGALRGRLAKGRAAYQARHSVALELGERGIDLGDVQGWLGHKHVRTYGYFIWTKRSPVSGGRPVRLSSLSSAGGEGPINRIAVGHAAAEG